jgi:tRNA threonylcarbamoyladenosine biosynthesis protein TsaE
MNPPVLIPDLTKLAEFAKTLLKKVQTQVPSEARVIALSGDLGAGKTTLVQLLATELGVTETVTSPTFTIMKKYQTGEGQSRFKNLVHMDAYRIESLSELRPLQLSPIFESADNLICIEWAEKIKPALPANTCYLNLKILENEAREITIMGGDYSH